MATTSKPYTFSAGATIKASEHNNNFDTLFVDFNGNITNANFSGSAAIADTKLAQITTSSKVDFSALSTTNQAAGDILFYSGTNLWVRLARGTANQSLKCQHDSQTVLLLSCDGTDGSTAFTDSSLSVKTVTVNGNAQIDTAQSKFGGASALFDGTGDYLSLADSNDWNFGSGDFTIDFQVRWNVLPTAGNQSLIMSQVVDGSNNQYITLENNSGVYSIRYYVYSSASNIILINKTVNPSVNTWYHYTLVRSGNSWYWFVEGTQVGTTDTETDSVPDFVATLEIARYFDGTSTFTFNGWLDEIRISKGIARWTANFTPETVAYLPVPIWIT